MKLVFLDCKLKTFQVDPNEKMGLGKELLIGYRLPIVGDYIFSATVTEFVDGKYVFEEEILFDNPRIYFSGR